MHIIAGLYRHQHLKAPKGSQTRPTSSRLREALFNICQHAIEGIRFLDLFAGSGAMGLEALSRGAKHATFIDSDKEAIKCIESNIQQLKVQDQARLLRGEVHAKLELLQRENQQFEMIYADPPYGICVPHTSILYSEQIVQWMDKSNLLVSGGLLFIEEDFRIELKADSLQTLYLKNHRKMGQSALYQFQKM